MVHTRAAEEAALDIPEGYVRCGRGQALHGNAPPPPPCSPISLEQLLMMQNELMRMLTENKAHRGACRPQHPRQQDMNTLYSDFLATHLPLFFRVKDPLEANDWLYTTELKFGLLHCIEYQKTICRPRAQRLSRSQVGIIHCRTASGSSSSMR
jgi:hypothetical protein